MHIKKRLSPGESRWSIASERIEFGNIWLRRRENSINLETKMKGFERHGGGIECDGMALAIAVIAQAK